MVLSLSALYPTAVLLLAVVLFVKAATPMAVLTVPLVFELRAS